MPNSVRPGDVLADRYRLVDLLTESGKTEEAMKILAPLAKGNDPDVLNAYGIALADQGKIEAANEQFQRVLQTAVLHVQSAGRQEVQSGVESRVTAHLLQEDRGEEEHGQERGAVQRQAEARARRAASPRPPGPPCPRPS